MSRKRFFATKLGEGEPKKYPLLFNNTEGVNQCGGTVSFFYDEGGVTARFECDCEGEIMEPYKGYNEPVYRGDVVEFFLSPGASETHYFEFDTSPRGVNFNARITNIEGNTDIELIEEGTVKYTPCVTDGHFVMDTYVPFSLVLPSGVSSPRDIPWIFNAYRIDRHGGAGVTFYSASPTLIANFHIPERFGELIFE